MIIISFAIIININVVIIIDCYRLPSNVKCQPASASIHPFEATTIFAQRWLDLIE